MDTSKSSVVSNAREALESKIPNTKLCIECILFLVLYGTFLLCLSLNVILFNSFCNCGKFGR